MEPKVSSTRETLSPPDSVSNPQEKEVSDEEDDDRNHKHRRRETRSQSMERDDSDRTSGRPYRKKPKQFENGYYFKGNESQTSEGWRNYNPSSLGKDLSSKFERRRPGSASVARVPLDLSQRLRGNQKFSGELGHGWGRDANSWNQCDPRFSSAVDIASHIVQPSSMAPSIFGGRGLSKMSSAQSTSWSAFGMLPRVPNGGIDTFHSIGLQGTLRPSISPSLNMAIPRQRCRDFEERGFCLRGDMCPMEHGVNRIVVEDVQSLSQFNLPVSLPSAPQMAPPVGPGPLPSVHSPSTLMNGKGTHCNSNQSGMSGDGVALNDAYSGAGGADFYDPDQPLWKNGAPETSAALSALQSPKNDETVHMLDDDRRQGADSEVPTGAVGSHNSSLSVWARIKKESKEDQTAIVSAEDSSLRGKQNTAVNAGPKSVKLSATTANSSVHNVKNPSQKATRTLFVNRIPLKSNRRDSLLSHFQKFGDVIDIYIPSNSERAFVQFSKREEAEAALKAPDAVMGNRFIKLWWANRDSIPDDCLSSSSGVPKNFLNVRAGSVPSHQPIDNGKSNLQSVAPKGNIVRVSLSDQPKTINSNDSKVLPSRKNDTLEQLKEELRQKQAMLDKKRTDFRRKLAELEKQSTGVKREVMTEQAPKRVKVGVADDLAKVATTSSLDLGTTIPDANVLTDSNKHIENIVSHSPKSSTGMMLKETTGLKQNVHPFTSRNDSVMMTRYKLDNRPTAFKVVPPLPTGFANVVVVKNHFSSFGEIPTVELEDTEAHDNAEESVTSIKLLVRVSFTTRHSAEKAFTNGKCWQGQTLQFAWLTSNSFSNPIRTRENHSSAIIESLESIATKTDTADGIKEFDKPEAASKTATADGIEEFDKPDADGIEELDKPDADGIEELDKPDADGIEELDKPDADGIEELDKPDADGIEELDKPDADGIEEFDIPEAETGNDPLVLHEDNHQPSPTTPSSKKESHDADT